MRAPDRTEWLLIALAVALLALQAWLIVYETIRPR